MPGVLVVCETKDGKLKKTTREALTVGRALAESGAGDLLAVAGGPAAGSVAEECGRFGAKKVFVFSDAALEGYTTELVTAAVAGVVREAAPSVVLIPGTSNGRDLAPRLAARLDVGVASDVDSLTWKEGKLVGRRPLYSGRVFATVEVEGAPAIATCRPNAFPASEGNSASPEVVQQSFAAPEVKSKLLDTKAPDSEELTIADADIIVSGGRGLKEAANFSHVRELAGAIGGAVGASRATVDAGWIDHQHQVGQTGRVVSPNLYIAIGISGAIQHLAGMSSSKHIVAINKDPEAPILKAADLAVVGDLFTIVPALTEEVKKAKEQH